MTHRGKHQKDEHGNDYASGPVVDREGSDGDRGLAALSYLGFLSFVSYLLKKDSRFVRFHATQGIGLFAIEVLMLIPIFWILWLPALVLVTMGFIKALNGEYWKIPFVHDIGNYVIKVLKI
jgi:uncharacterized membrane protein